LGFGYLTLTSSSKVGSTTPAVMLAVGTILQWGQSEEEFQ
jgi:hypothetical protein